MKRVIEEGFPIVEINRLAVPERNAFKPIYQMHKWLARRASCVFRAILLGCLKPAGTDIMAEFYKDHTNDPDTVEKVVLDLFMGTRTRRRAVRIPRVVLPDGGSPDGQVEIPRKEGGGCGREDKWVGRRGARAGCAGTRG